MKIKNIIFDWDGTLGMTLHLWLEGYRNALSKLGYSLTDSHIARNFFYEHEQGQLKYPEISFPKLIEDAHSHVHSNIHNLSLYKGAEETLKSLKDQGIGLALVSSSKEYLLMKGLSTFGLEKYFSSIISGDDVKKGKPDPEAFNQTMKRIKSKPENTLIIGDAKSDIIAGKAANTYTCLFTPSENEIFYDFQELLETKPDFNIFNQIEFPEIIKNS